MPMISWIINVDVNQSKLFRTYQVVNSDDGIISVCLESMIPLPYIFLSYLFLSFWLLLQLKNYIMPQKLNELLTFQEFQK